MHGSILLCGNMSRASPRVSFAIWPIEMLETCVKSSCHAVTGSHIAVEPKRKTSSDVYPGLFLETGYQKLRTYESPGRPIDILGVVCLHSSIRLLPPTVSRIQTQGLSVMQEVSFYLQHSEKRSASHVHRTISCTITSTTG